MAFRQVFQKRGFMYIENVNDAVLVGVNKVKNLKSNPFGYFIASILAGIYVGLGIILIFSIGAPFASLNHPALKLIMGASFGIALSLVVFAGSELFTGNVMFLTFSILRKKIRLFDLIAVWIVSWIGNLVGSIALAWLAVSAGSIGNALPFFGQISVVKMNLSPWELIGRGLLCNMLVCLALWTAGRVKSEVAKLILIFWCLFAFIGSGYEHSIANMTLIAIGVFGDVAGQTGWNGYFYNLLWVTIGNILGGAVVIAGTYHLIAREKPVSADV
jgi:nitrite transporter NirC